MEEIVGVEEEGEGEVDQGVAEVAVILISMIVF